MHTWDCAQMVPRHKQGLFRILAAVMIKYTSKSNLKITVYQHSVCLWYCIYCVLLFFNAVCLLEKCSFDLIWFDHSKILEAVSETSERGFRTSLWCLSLGLQMCYWLGCPHVDELGDQCVRYGMPLYIRISPNIIWRVFDLFCRISFSSSMLL